MPSVLIIDDEPDVGDAIRRVLELEGFAVTVTGGGNEGLLALERGPVDVVITDIIMPKIHGIDVIRTIRAKYGTDKATAILQRCWDLEKLISVTDLIGMFG